MHFKIFIFIFEDNFDMSLATIETNQPQFETQSKHYKQTPILTLIIMKR